MAEVVTFDSTVAARTRAAEKILNTPALLALYQGKGGLKSDLEEIRDEGKKAELLSQARGTAQAVGGAATVAVLETFTALQKEYSGVMGVLQAVKRDLGKENAPAVVVKTVDHILRNEAEVMIATVEGKDGAAKKRAVRRESQEALRAEIARDARAMVELTTIHPHLAKRQVDKLRLEAMLVMADGLSGKLADRTTAKGDPKKVTAAIHEAVKAQKDAWGACYRLLAQVGQEDPGVEDLLKAAARPKRTQRTPKK